MTKLTGNNKVIYDELKSDPNGVSDQLALRYYEDGLNDRSMPPEGDTFEWATWVAGRRTRTENSLSAEQKRELANLLKGI